MKKVIPFNIDLALNGADVRTKRDLYKVRNITLIDSPNPCRVLGQIYHNEQRTGCQWTILGNYSPESRVHGLDLVIMLNLKDYIKYKFKAFLK